MFFPLTIYPNHHIFFQLEHLRSLIQEQDSLIKSLPATIQKLENEAHPLDIFYLNNISSVFRSHITSYRHELTDFTERLSPKE